MIASVNRILFMAIVFSIGATNASRPTCGPRIEGLQAVVPGVRLVAFGMCVKLHPDDVFLQPAPANHPGVRKQTGPVWL